MGDLSAVAGSLLAAAESPGVLKNIWFYVQIFIGFSFIIFVHELGHFAVAKWAGVRVERFAIGFFREIFGFTRGETRYSFNLLPLGGYVKMLGQEDFEVDITGELLFKDDPRSFANKPVGHRMAIVSAGVIMNLLLAGVLFMIVFLVGKQVPIPRVGAVLPDGPAALHENDRPGADQRPGGAEGYAAGGHHQEDRGQRDQRVRRDQHGGGPVQTGPGAGLRG